MSYYHSNVASPESRDDSDDAAGKKEVDFISDDDDDDNDDDSYYNRKSTDQQSDHDEPNYNDAPEFRPPAVRQRGLSSHSESSSYDTEGYQARKSIRGSSSQSDEPTAINDSLELSSQSESDDQQNNYPKRQWTEDNASCSKRHRGLSILSNSTSADSDRDDEQPPQPMEQSKARKMLEKMGYQHGMGLGKYSQGRKEPIEESKQRGKRGLGFKIEGLITQGEKFRPEMEEISVNENVTWLNGSQDDPNLDQLKTWVVIGPRKMTIDDENLFCHSNVLKNILLSKSVFDKLQRMELSRARSRANPFETIKGEFFLNRAAMKMANLDAVFNFMFTNPKDRYGNELLDKTKLLYFADVCAGPGGFSEYVLWRKKWRAKGIGFTLRGEHDFKLDDFFAAPCESFDPFYGINEDGDVYNPDNIESLYEHVMKQTQDGVHFMMADGGFSVEGQENIQEVLSKRLYLCQCLVALRIVRPGGHFVVKLFDLFTPFSVGLIYLMHMCFDRISIHKPNTSRPANSERYFICEFKRDNDIIEPIVTYLTKINIKLGKIESSDQDINEIVHKDILTDSDSEFFKYIYNSNNALGEKQVISLLKIAAFAENQSMIEERQSQLRKECLQLYGITEKTRTAPLLIDPTSKLAEFWGSTPIEKITMTPLEPGTFTNELPNAPNWLFCIIGSRQDDDIAQPTLFYGQGGAKILRLEGRNKWTLLRNITQIELPRDTLILGELVPEFEGDRACQKKVVTLFILDAVRLAGEDLSKEPFKKRLEMVELFAKAIRRPGNLIQPKLFLPVANVCDVFDCLEVRTHKNGYPCRALPLTKTKFLKPGGMLFMPNLKFSWVECFSSTHQRPYYFNTKTGHKPFELPKAAVADVAHSFNNMKIWWWDQGVRLKCDRNMKPDNCKLQPDELLSHLNKPI